MNHGSVLLRKVMAGNKSASRLQEHIERVSTILEEYPDDVIGIVREVSRSAAVMVSEPLDLEQLRREAPVDAYDRILLHHDEKTGFAIIAMVWPPGEVTPIHDHGTWGVVAVLSGELEVTRYDRLPVGQRGEGVILQRPHIDAVPGMVDVVIPPDEDIHSIRNPLEKISVSIHTYGGLMETYNVYDIETGQKQLRETRSVLI